jgi:hydroxyacylglutathione hydrolase
MNWTLFILFVVLPAIFVFLFKNERARFILFNRVIRPLGYRLYLFETIGMIFHRFMISQRRELQPDPVPHIFRLGNLRPQQQRDDKDTTFEVIGIPFLSDNYCYIIMYDIQEQIGDQLQTKTKAVAVDPADAEAVEEFIKRQNKEVTLSYILTTHKHWDHAGGNVALKQKFPDVVVVGSELDRVAACTKYVRDKEEFVIDDLLHVRVIHTPCHTIGHVMYVVSMKNNSNPGDAAVFSGDHLFVGGCGAMFEGSLTSMRMSMDKLKQDIDMDSRIYCGHEYSLQLLYAAQMIEPNNYAVDEKLEWVRERRRQHLPTVPTTLREELEYNPYLRDKVYTIQGL